jgi:hypothetical protein
MPSTLAVDLARVCVRNVSKAVRFLPAVAPNPDRELAEARACIDRGDERDALRRLDRARRGFVKNHDVAGLDHLLVMADVLEADDESLQAGRANLDYAVKQNLRLETRRKATAAGEPWVDPYPNLESPAEHTRFVVTGAAKVWIGLGVALGTVLLVGVLVLPWFFDSTHTRVTIRVLNDTPGPVVVRGCNDVPDCDSAWLRNDLDPGLAAEGDVDADDLVDLFKIERPGRVDACLPVRIHDGYQQLDGGSGTLVARVSEATPCPGTTVMPAPVAETEIGL